MGMPAIRRHWTTADVRALNDESPGWPRYELIDGELIVTPSPGNEHQIAVSAMLNQLYNYLELEPIGVVFTSPADLELRPGTITQPDVFIIPVGGAPTKEAWTWSDVRRLLLAVEVISPSSVRTDRITKREYYMDVGVPDYFIIDIHARIIERWSPERETPLVLRDQLVWQPAGATQPLSVSLPAFFDGIAAKWRSIHPELPS
jgi:Uma2 family endonuclease